MTEAFPAAIKKGLMFIRLTSRPSHSGISEIWVKIRARRVIMCLGGLQI